METLNLDPKKVATVLGRLPHQEYPEVGQLRVNTEQLNHNNKMLENMEFNNTLYIITISVGSVIILMAIAILYNQVRLSSKVAENTRARVANTHT